ncbi:hypothetical protein SAMN05660206_102395 [Sphingobacterium wenxiniae]|uniref:Uncharacterized protein n=1 Tax=Sphingobacterium wenxiniae TaxID=683125 RepID=A0A1I6QL00_9SPHI|nr:hypothetical protein SAMN05660206_102395 [Sphingobacterium wenxiniae]
MSTSNISSEYFPLFKLKDEGAFNYFYQLHFFGLVSFAFNITKK